MISSLQCSDKMRKVTATMVKMLWRGVVIAAVLPVPVAKALDAACAAKPGDEAAIVGTLRGMYAAATADDRAKMRSYFAPGFYMFDGGNRYEGDSVMDPDRGFLQEGCALCMVGDEAGCACALQ